MKCGCGRRPWHAARWIPSRRGTKGLREPEPGRTQPRRPRHPRTRAPRPRRSARRGRRRLHPLAAEGPAKGPAEGPPAAAGSPASGANAAPPGTSPAGRRGVAGVVVAAADGGVAVAGVGVVAPDGWGGAGPVAPGPAARTAAVGAGTPARAGSSPRRRSAATPPPASAAVVAATAASLPDRATSAAPWARTIAPAARSWSEAKSSPKRPVSPVSTVQARRRQQRGDGGAARAHRGERGPAGRAVAQVRARLHELLGRRLAVGERGQDGRPALALLAGLDAVVAAQEGAAALGDAAVDLRVRPALPLGDLVVRQALGLQPQRGDLLGLETLQRLGRPRELVEALRAFLDRRDVAPVVERVERGLLLDADELRPRAPDREGLVCGRRRGATGARRRDRAALRS